MLLITIIQQYHRKYVPVKHIFVLTAQSGAEVLCWRDMVIGFYEWHTVENLQEQINERHRYKGRPYKKMEDDTYVKNRFTGNNNRDFTRS